MDGLRDFGLICRRVLRLVALVFDERNSSFFRSSFKSKTHRLRFKLDRETRVYVAFNGRGEFQDLRARRAATVHQNQRLPVVHSGRTDRAAFPAALVDQPACSQFELTIMLLVRHEIRFKRLQRVEGRGAHYRVLEETSRIPEHPPVGQLCLTHGNDGIEDSLVTVLTTFLKRTGDIRVIRAWRPRFRQTKGHRYNHKTPAPFLLEKTVAVAERARVAIEFPHFSRR